MILIFKNLPSLTTLLLFINLPTTMTPKCKLCLHLLPFQAMTLGSLTLEICITLLKMSGLSQTSSHTKEKIMWLLVMVSKFPCSMMVQNFFLLLSRSFIWRSFMSLIIPLISLVFLNFMLTMIPSLSFILIFFCQGSGYEESPTSRSP